MMTAFAIIAAGAALVAMAVFGFRHRLTIAQAAAEIRSLKRGFENDLALARAERDRLLDALGDAFLLVDSDARLRFANAAARDLFGGRDLVKLTVRETFLDPRLAKALLPWPSSAVISKTC